MAVTIKMFGPTFDEMRKDIDHIKGGFEKAFARASSRVASQGKTLISKDIRQTANLKAGDVNKALKTAKHKAGASVTLKEEVRLPLKYFGAKQTAKGVSYKLEKKKGRSFVRGAFGPNIPRLGNHVFIRAGASRLPIIPLFGVSPWGVFVVKKLYEPTKKKLQVNFAKRLRHEIDYLIEKGQTRNG